MWSRWRSPWQSRIRCCCIRRRNNAIDLALAHSPLCQQFAQEPAAWQFFHLQAVLGDFSFGLEGKIGSRLVDWKDVQVNIRTKSTIQLELALAKVVSLFQGAEV